MRKQKQFTEEQKLQLLKSPYIEKVHSNHLEYTLEFKQFVGWVKPNKSLTKQVGWAYLPNKN